MTDSRNKDSESSDYKRIFWSWNVVLHIFLKECKRTIARKYRHDIINNDNHYLQKNATISHSLKCVSTSVNRETLSNVHEPPTHVPPQN